jgi:two-component system chemotaxis response regulator CheB
MSGRRSVVVVGASAGGVEALRVLVGTLRPDLGAPVYVVLHLPPRGPHALPDILARASTVPAVSATDGRVGRPGTVYVAPPDFHLLLGPGGVMTLSQDPEIDGHRPSVDALFRSAAALPDARVVAVLLTGSGNDGSAGLVAVDAAGGVSIVQDPDEARYPSMPTQARQAVPRAIVCRSDQLGPLVTAFVRDEGLTMQEYRAPDPAEEPAITAPPDS